MDNKRTEFLTSPAFLMLVITFLQSFFGVGDWVAPDTWLQAVLDIIGNIGVLVSLWLQKPPNQLAWVIQKY